MRELNKNCSLDTLRRAAQGEEITREEALVLIDPAQTPLDDLIRTADAVTRRNFGNKIGLCAIYPAKVGACSGDCAFCAQSARHNCDVTPVNVKSLDADAIVENAKTLYELGIRRYSLVTSGERLTDTEFEVILQIIGRLHNETSMELCASLGSLTADRAKMLTAVGVKRYHHNIETSRSFFPSICSTHSYDDKLYTINIAREHGMQVCCGGILALGETPAQRVEMAFELKELDIDCVPLNILNPIVGTRLEKQPALPADELLRAIAIFRLVLPRKTLRFAGGREKALGEDEHRGFAAGINAILAGNYLTTQGKPFAKEMHTLESLGLEVEL